MAQQITYKIELTSKEYDYLFCLLGRQLGNLIKYAADGFDINNMNAEEVNSINLKLADAYDEACKH